MTILYDTVWQELNNTIKTTLGLDSTTIITKAVKMERQDWHRLLVERELLGGSAGAKTPFVVLRIGNMVPADMGLADISYNMEVEVFLFRRQLDRIATTVTTGAASVTQHVGSTTGMFVNQRLYFATAGVYRRVATIVDATHVTVNASVTTTTGEAVTSDTPADVELLLETLRDDLLRGSTHTSFQILEDSVIDCGDLNPANQVLAETDQNIYVGSISLTLYAGYLP